MQHRLQREMSPFLIRKINLCCTQIISTSYFQGAITRKAFNIRHFVTSKSSWVIYLMECYSQYIPGKSKYIMNLRIDTHRKNILRADDPPSDNIWRADDPPSDKNFQNSRHNFNEHAKSTNIEKISNASLPKQ